MDIFVSVIALTLLTLAKYGAVWVAIIVIEAALPRERVSWLSRLRSASYWIISIPIWAAAVTLFVMLWRALGVNHLLSPVIATGAAWLDVVLAVLLGNVIADFFFYWRHRIQHRWFWRYHRVHHSIRELSGINSYHHISEELFRIALVALPMSLLFSQQEAVAAGIVGMFIGFYAHANTRLTMGPLRYLILDPTVHRIHHSTDPAHFGKNFCGFTPLWDVVFGTAYFPAKGVWPETGLADHPEPETAVEWLSAPWRQERGKAAVGTA